VAKHTYILQQYIHLHLCQQGDSYGTVTRLMAGWCRVGIWTRARYFSVTNHSHHLWGTRSLLSKGYQSSFSGV